MKDVSKLGRPVRLGLISVGKPEGYVDHVRRSCVLSSEPKGLIDLDAGSVLHAIKSRTQNWIAFNVCVGSDVLDGERYLYAVRWLLDAGVDAIVCTTPVQDEELRAVCANQHARTLGVPVILADSERHVDKAGWEQGVIMAAADQTLDSDEAVWNVDPERCRVGGSSRDNASAAGVVASVALAEVARSLPRAELLDSLRAWALMPSPRLAS